MINLEENFQETAFFLKKVSRKSVKTQIIYIIYTFVNLQFFKDIHGLFMLFSWSFLADIGVILVRHFKVRKN